MKMSHFALQNFDDFVWPYAEAKSLLASTPEAWRSHCQYTMEHRDLTASQDNGCGIVRWILSTLSQSTEVPWS